MELIENLCFKVNGRTYGHVDLRASIRDGAPHGPLEPVVHDTQFGEIALTNAFKIEYSMNEEPWRSVTTEQFIQFLLSHTGCEER